MNKSFRYSFRQWKAAGLWGICLALFGCGSGASLSLDESLSNSLRNQPYESELISEIRIYRTDGNAFLTSEQLERLLPIKVLSSKTEMESFARTLAKGRLPNTASEPGSFHYQQTSYHIIAVNRDGTKYGYLKARMSSDSGKPIVAQVQAPDGTGSYEYVASLPEILEALAANEIKK
jgi:hypothetical protein